jgi:hypothetical protein
MFIASPLRYAFAFKFGKMQLSNGMRGDAQALMMRWIMRRLSLGAFDDDRDQGAIFKVSPSTLTITQLPFGVAS